MGNAQPGSGGYLERIGGKAKEGGTETVSSKKWLTSWARQCGRQNLKRSRSLGPPNEKVGQGKKKKLRVGHT